MTFTEQDALQIAKKAYPNDPDVWANMVEGMMTIYNIGLEEGKSIEVKQAYWEGVKAGVKRYSYWHRPQYAEVGMNGKLNESYKAVGPQGTTKLDYALYQIEQEAQAALKS